MANLEKKRYVKTVNYRLETSLTHSLLVVPHNL